MVRQLTMNITTILQLQRKTAKMRHLGLPLIFPRAKSQVLDDLKECIFNRISGWKSKLLSRAGRTTLISTVATSMPSYFMSSLLLPEGWCKLVNQRLKNFWWGFDPSNTHHLTLKSWQSMCLPKSMKGLGIWDLSRMNVAPLPCQEWNVLSNEPSLWVSICKASIFAVLVFGSLTLSSGFMGLAWYFELRPHLRSIVCCQIRDGESNEVWKDPWVVGIVDFPPQPRSVVLVKWEDEKISSLISPITHQWDRKKASIKGLMQRLFHIYFVSPLHLDGGHDC